MASVSKARPSRWSTTSPSEPASRDRLTALFLATATVALESSTATARWLDTTLPDAILRLDLDSRAHLALLPKQSRLYGDQQQLLVAFQPEDPDVVSWVAAAIGSLEDQVDRSFHIRLDRAYRPLVAELAPSFGVTKAIVVGRVDDAAGYFAAHPAPLPLGVRSRAMTAADVRAVVRQRSTFFQANPTLGFARLEGRNPERQAQIDADVSADLRTRCKTGTEHVLEADGRIVGSLGFRKTAETASIDMFLHPSLHGRGLGWGAYQVLTGVMVDHGMRRVTGLTSNPAVRHISRALGRREVAYHLGYRSHFIPLDLR